MVTNDSKLYFLLIFIVMTSWWWWNILKPWWDHIMSIRWWAFPHFIDLKSTQIYKLIFYRFEILDHWSALIGRSSHLGSCLLCPILFLSVWELVAKGKCLKTMANHLKRLKTFILFLRPFHSIYLYGMEPVYRLYTSVSNFSTNLPLG